MVGDRHSHPSFPVHFAAINPEKMPRPCTAHNFAGPAAHAAGCRPCASGRRPQKPATAGAWPACESLAPCHSHSCKPAPRSRRRSTYPAADERPSIAGRTCPSIPPAADERHNRCLRRSKPRPRPDTQRFIEPKRFRAIAANEQSHPHRSAKQVRRSQIAAVAHPAVPA